MWHQPLRVNRIPVKASAQLIVHSAFRHFPGGVFDHLQCFIRTRAMMRVQEKLEVHCRRKLGSSTKTAIRAVIVRRDPAKRAVENIVCEQLARLLSESDTS